MADRIEKQMADQRVLLAAVSHELRTPLARAGVDPAVLCVEAPRTRFLGDPTLIARALANLVDNAVRHGGGLLALRIQQRPGSIAFEADDAGPGFADGDEERAFQPFYRGAKQSRSDVGSLGLGLALVSRIAQAHGGSAHAFNRPGGGACVVFEVKQAGELGEAVSPARPADGAGPLQSS